MTTATTTAPTKREPELLGQTVVVIGGSAGIGLETARRARAEGADVILTGRNPHRLQHAASEIGASSTAAFDANDSEALEAFFGNLAGPIDHVMVTAGSPYYARLADIDFDEARRALQEHPMLMVGVARYGAPKVRSGGTLLFMGGTGARRPGVGVGLGRPHPSQRRSPGAAAHVHETLSADWTAEYRFTAQDGSPVLEQVRVYGSEPIAAGGVPARLLRELRFTDAHNFLREQVRRVQKGARTR